MISDRSNSSRNEEEIRSRTILRKSCVYFVIKDKQKNKLAQNLIYLQNFVPEINYVPEQGGSGINMKNCLEREIVRRGQQAH